MYIFKTTYLKDKKKNSNPYDEINEFSWRKQVFTSQSVSYTHLPAK